MRAGLTASAVAHIALITAIVIGFRGATPMEPEQIESISVDLVPVEEVSNIRSGIEDSKIVETQTPSVVDTQKEAKLAEPTGNTEKDQPTPQQSDRATPAPTVKTAPAPQTRPTDTPAPKPEPEPAPTAEPAPKDEQPAAPEPKPEPKPEPQPTPDPVLQTVPDQASEPQQVAPRPEMKTAAVEKARAEYRRKLQQQEEAKKAAEAKKQQEEARKAAEAKKQQEEKSKPADRISDIINQENTRGATTGSGGQASVGKPTGTAARLTQSERDALIAKIKSCFNPPIAAMTQSGFEVQVLFRLNRDGSVAGEPQVETPITSDTLGATARAAVRAVSACQPYTMLSPEKYAEWQQVDVTFDPHDL